MNRQSFRIDSQTSSLGLKLSNITVSIVGTPASRRQSSGPFKTIWALEPRTIRSANHFFGNLLDVARRLRNHWPFLRRIVTTRVPRMTTTDPSRAFAESSNQPILLHGQNEVLAARRIETTSPPEPRADQILVQFHCTNRQQSGCQEQTSPQVAGRR